VVGKISETIVVGICPVKGLSAQGRSVMLLIVSELLQVVVASRLWPNPSFHWTAVGSVSWGADARGISAASDFSPLGDRVRFCVV